MEIKVIDGESGETEVKLMPSVKGGAFLIKAAYGKRTLTVAVPEIKLDISGRWQQEIPALRNGNSYLKRQYVKTIDGAPGAFMLGVVPGIAEISSADGEGNESSPSVVNDIFYIQEVAPYPRRASR